MKKYWARQFGKPTGFGGRIATFIMNRANGANYKAVVETVPKSGEILDIGFGNGYLIKKLSANSDATIYGVDISADMVKNATKRNKKAVKEGKVVLTLGLVDNIPFDAQFDFIYTVNTVYFWQDLKAGLSHIKEKLKDGGTFINVLFTKEFLAKHSYTQYGFTKYEPQELLAVTAEAGFSTEIIEIEKAKSFFVKATKRESQFKG